MKTHYQTLGVTPDASLEVIEAVWRTLSKKYHPDNKLTGNEELSRAVNHAHDVLKNPKKRAAYDQSLPGDPRAANSAFTGWPQDAGVNEGAYPNAYTGLTQDLQPVMQEFGTRIAEKVLEQVFQNVPPELVAIMKRAMNKAGGK